MDYRQPGSSVHGILQARILGLVAMSSSRGSSLPRVQTHFYSVLACRIFTPSTTWETQNYHMAQESHYWTCTPVGVQSLSHIWLFMTSGTAACQASLSLIISQSWPKLMSIASVTPSYHLIFCHAILLLPLIFPSNREFSNESAVDIRWSKYWRFNFSISPSNEYSGFLLTLRKHLIFPLTWFDLLTA